MGALTVSDLTPMAGEPHVLDMKVAEALGFTNPRSVRVLIKRHREELLRYGPLRQSDAPIRSGKGRVQLVSEFWLNEPQALLAIMFARTEKAAAVRTQVIQVFLAWRRGELTGPPVEVDPTVVVLERLERRLAALERAGQQLNALILEPVESALALTHAVDVWSYQIRQARPRFWSDVQVRGLILAAHRQMTIDQCRTRCVEIYGDGRAPSRTAIGRFWKLLDRLRGEYPSLKAH